MKNKQIIFTLLLSTTFFALQGQTLDDARNWYLEGRYADALPIFRKAYVDDSTNAALNQWLGVSLLKTGRIVEAEQYLTFAEEKKIPEATLYLGELFSKVYRFDDAEKAYERYQKAQRRNKEALAKLDLFREETAQLQKRVLRTEEVVIIDSLVLPKRDFLQAYYLSSSSGTLQPINDFFSGTPAGNKILHLNERGDKMYYSRESTGSGQDLFTMDKLIDRFGNERKLPETINDPGNQAFPYVLSDGLTLYFASTGHASLGGYDLYVTRYNLSTDSYLAPNQMNMPFNSPFNDYLMVIDEEKGIGWFASDRFQHVDSVCVYTFIPNKEVTLLADDNLTLLSNRAKISSIADTWKEGIDYDPLREKARQKTISLQEAAGDFDFVINDDVTYHTLSDFKNDNARSIFLQALGLEGQWQKLRDDLSEKREQYANGNKSEALRRSILSMEKEIDTLPRDIERLKREARNEESRTHYSLN